MADEITDASSRDDSAQPRFTREDRFEPPSVMMEKSRQSHKTLLMVVRMLFLVLLVSVTLITVASLSQREEEFDPSTVVGLFLASTAVGIIVLIVDSLTPHKRLASMVGIYLGVCVGLIGALAIGALLDVLMRAWSLDKGRFPVYFGLAKVVVAIVLCYMAVSFVLTTKDNFRLVIPYVEFSKQVRGVRPMLLDTSVLIDGRIDSLGQTGFLDAPLIVPQFVLEELQALADSHDKLKRARGRRGLDLVSRLQANPYVDLSLDDSRPGGHGVDQMLVQMAGDQNLRILTTDNNLQKVAKIRGVTVVNLNDLANTVKAQALPGESLEVDVVKHGEGANQGVGYMADGTMVVIEDAGARVGQTVHVTVTNTLQTSAGRMIFARVEDGNGSFVPHMAAAATNQPRMTERPGAGSGSGAGTGSGFKREESEGRRNPRR